MWQIILAVVLVLVIIAAAIYFAYCNAGNPTIALTESATDIKVSWQPVAGITSYKVLIGNESGKYNQTFPITTTTYAIKKDACRKYYIVVKSVDGTCESSASNEVFVESKFAPPTIKDIIKRGDRLSVQVNPVDGAQFYTVFVGPNATSFPWTNKSQYTTVDVVIPSQDCVDLHVKAFANTATCQSNDSEVKIYPQKLLSTRITGIDSSLLMTWQKVEGAKEYTLLQKKQDEAEFKQVTITGINSYRLPSMECGQSYNFIVRTTNNGCTSISEQFNFTKNIPPAPTGIQIQ